jgi:hypothetical protein
MRIRYANHATPLSAKLTLTSQTCGGRSVGMVRLWTNAMEFLVFLVEPALERTQYSI